MKRLFQLGIAALAIAVLSTSCFVRVQQSAMTGDGEVAVAEGTNGSRSMDLADYDEVYIYGAFDVRCLVGEPSAVITGPDELIKYVKVECKDGKTTVKMPKSGVRDAGRAYIRIDLYSVSISKVYSSGASDISVEKLSGVHCGLTISGAGDASVHGIEADEVSLKINGSGDINAVGIAVGELDADISGSGDIYLSGKADDASASISGSGVINAKKLECGRFSSKISGSGVVNR